MRSNYGTHDETGDKLKYYIALIIEDSVPVFPYVPKHEREDFLSFLKSIHVNPALYFDSAVERFWPNPDKKSVFLAKLKKEARARGVHLEVAKKVSETYPEEKKQDLEILKDDRFYVHLSITIAQLQPRHSSYLGAYEKQGVLGVLYKIGDDSYFPFGVPERQLCLMLKTMRFVQARVSYLKGLNFSEDFYRIRNPQTRPWLAETLAQAKNLIEQHENRVACEQLRWKTPL